MRDPVSLPLLPRSNLQPQSLRREDEADPGSNHKSVSYRYVEPQIYSGVGMYMYVLCCKRRESRSRGGGLCWALLPGEVVAEAEARGSGGGGTGTGDRGDPSPGSGGGGGVLPAARGLSLLCRERAGAFQCKWGTWSSAAPTNQRSLGHFELILKLRKPGAGERGCCLPPRSALAMSQSGRVAGPTGGCCRLRA